MCGRYRRTTQEEELARLYHIPIPKQTDLPISYNIAPSQQVLTIRFNPETRQRSLNALQWGLIPFSIGMKDDAPFVFAGLWEGWKDPATHVWLRTCTIITGEPNELVAQIHSRMPVILAEEHHEAWLTNQAGKEVLVPFPGSAMRAWAISPRVNSPKNNDPGLLLPVEGMNQVSPTKIKEIASDLFPTI